MSLSDSVLTGVRARWKTLAKNLARSKQRSKVRCGRWMEQKGTLSSLLEARQIFGEVLDHNFSPGAGKEEDWCSSLKRAVSGLLQAVWCAESRDGLCKDGLTEVLLAESVSVVELVDQEVGFSLCHALPERFRKHTPSTLVACGSRRQTVANSGGVCLAGVVE